MFYVHQLFLTFISIIVMTNSMTIRKSVSDHGKKILRYGYHRTQECNNFDLAFICVQKCLDHNFDVAHSDKNCMCTCYNNKDKAKYKNDQYGLRVTKWRYGAPTTKHPAWILPLLPNKQALHELEVEHHSGEVEVHDGHEPDQEEHDTQIDGAAADGAAADGTAADGAVADGAGADGAGADGAGKDGAGADGAAVDGATADGAGVDGAGADGAGADGAGADGAAADGAGADGAAAE